MSWKPLPADIPLDHEALQPPQQADRGGPDAALHNVVAGQNAPADMQADAPGYSALPADAQLDAPDQTPDQPQGKASGFTDEQKQAILDYIPKAKDASDLERFSSELTGGKQHVGNAQQVIDDYHKKGARQFSWAEPVFGKPDAPQQQPHDLRSAIGDALLTSLDTFIPGAEATLRKMQQDGSGKAFVEHAANAAAFDYGPEAGGFIDIVLHPDQYNEFGANVDRNIAHERANLKGDTSEHPIASGAGEVAGAAAITPIIGAVGEATNAARLAGNAGPKARALAQAAMEGAAFGSGAAGPDNRGAGAAEGAAVAPLVMGAVAAPAALYQAGKTVLSEAPTLARKIIAKAIDADQNTPASVAADITAANQNEVPMAIADTGENVRGLLAAASRSSGNARTIARDALEGRQADLSNRVVGAIQRDLGPVANPHEVADTLMTTARTEAAPLYDRAYAARVPDAFIEKLKPILQRPSMQKALANARNIAAEEGEDPAGIGLSVSSDGSTHVSAAPSWKTLDYIKRGMDDVVESYRNDTTGKLVLNTEGKAVNNTLRTFINMMDGANPVYAQARAAYGGPVSGINAMNVGRKLLNMTGDDIEARMRDMTPFQKQMAALGARRAMAETVASKGDTADVVNALVGTGKKRAMLGRLFGDRPAFQRFVDTLGQEKQGYRTFKQALLGSPTAPNLQDDATLQLATAAAEAVATGGLSPLQAVRYAMKFGVGKVGDKAKQQVASLLSNTDPARFRELATELRDEAIRRGLFNRKVGIVAGSAGNAAATAVPAQQPQ